MKKLILSVSLLLLWVPVSFSMESGAFGNGEPLPLELQALGSDDPQAQEDALHALGQKLDPTYLPILTALHEGSLHQWVKPDGIDLVILQSIEEGGEEIDVLLHPVTLERIKTWDELDENNAEEIIYISASTSKSRSLLRTILDRYRLYDPSEKIRRSAAIKIGNSGDASSISILRETLEIEKDKWVKHSLEEAVQQLYLSDPDPEIRRNAAIRLGEIKGLQSLPRLKSLLSEEPMEPDLGVRDAMKTAVEKIETYQGLQTVLGVAFNGVSLGSILFMMGLGLAITFGLMGVINMAHGEMMMIGAYTTFVLQELFSLYIPSTAQGVYFIAALPFSFMVTGCVGLLLEKSVIRFLYGRPLETLLATWGVSMILQQAVRWYFGDLISVNSPPWMRGGVEVMAGLVFPYNRIFIIGLGLLSLLGVYFLLTRTRLGLCIRAVTQNRNMSACLGISTRKVDSWTFAFGAGLAGLAGCALSLVGNVDPEMGKTYIVESFMVVVVGGVGKLAGTVFSALGIGMFTKILEPVIGGTGGAIYAKLMILIAIILFLQRKPSGLFPAKGRALEA